MIVFLVNIPVYNTFPYYYQRNLVRGGFKNGFF